MQGRGPSLNALTPPPVRRAAKRKTLYVIMREMRSQGWAARSGRDL